MASNWRTHWVREKSAIAQRLASGEVSAGYAEAVILICAALSALAAEVWPGRGIDRVRFIELLIRLGSDNAFCRTISLPLLTQSLEAEGRLSEAGMLARVFDVSRTARVLTGPEVDKPEDEVLAACPTIKSSDIRRFSYASLLYQEVRSSYAHEYRPGKTSGSWPMTRLQNQKVSYINQVANAPMGMERLVHFHVEWLGDLAVDLAGAVDALPAVPQAPPAAWWAGVTRS